MSACKCNPNPIGHEDFDMDGILLGNRIQFFLQCTVFEFWMDKTGYSIDFDAEQPQMIYPWTLAPCSWKPTLSLNHVFSRQLSLGTCILGFPSADWVKATTTRSSGTQIWSFPMGEGRQLYPTPHTIWASLSLTLSLLLLKGAVPAS